MMDTSQKSQGANSGEWGGLSSNFVICYIYVQGLRETDDILDYGSKSVTFQSYFRQNRDFSRKFIFSNATCSM